MGTTIRLDDETYQELENIKEMLEKLTNRSLSFAKVIRFLIEYFKAKKTEVKVYVYKGEMKLKLP